MTLLPIVQRELRVGARQAWLRWLRVAAIGLLTGLCFQFFSFTNVGVRGSAGQEVYQAIAWTIFLLAVCMFAVTADCLSRERREGTLVLLFLTDLKGYDVVFGKLAGAALNVLYVVLGFLPLLMLPVLAGGVTWAETGRMALAIISVAFVALSVGVWRSVRTSQTYPAMRSSVIWLASLLLVPRVLARWSPSEWADVVLSLSPLQAFMLSDEASYGVSQVVYWQSLTVGLLAGSFLIGLSCWTLMRNWREEFRAKGRFNPVLARRARQRRRMHGRAAVKLSPLYRSFAPVACAVMRVPGLRAAAWGGGVLNWLAGFLVVFGSLSFWGLLTYGVYTALYFTSIGLFAWMAGRFLCDAQRSGELELLVTTTAGATGIVRDQWFAVMRMLRGPLLLVGIGALPQAALSVSAGDLQGGELFGVLRGVCTMANAILGVLAICWVGMWRGLEAKRPSAVVMWTVGLVEGIPLAAVALLAGMSGLVAGGFAPMSLVPWVVVLPFLLVAKNLIFIWWAQRQLCKALRAPKVSWSGRRTVRDSASVLETPERESVVS